MYCHVSRDVIVKPFVSEGLCLVSGGFSRAVLFVVPCHIMASGFIRRVIDIALCPRRAAMRELRAVQKWRHVIKRILRIRRLRKYFLSWDSTFGNTLSSNEVYEANY